MNRQWAVQIFSVLAIVAGALVSYFPPMHNAEAAWTLIGTFLGYGIRDLFGPTVPPSAPAPVVLVEKQAGFANLGVLIVLSLLAGALFLAGCAATGTPRQTPQQLAAQVCPAAQVTISSLAALEGLTPAARVDLAQASPVVAAVCAPGAAVDLSSLRAMASTALPAMQRVVDAAGLPPDDHDRILLGLTVAQITLDGALMAAGAAPAP